MNGACSKYNTSVELRRPLILLAILILMLSLILLGWGLWPARQEKRSLILFPYDLALTPPVTNATVGSSSSSSSHQLSTPLQAAPEIRQLILEWPTAVRLHDVGVIRLALELDSTDLLQATRLDGGSQAQEQAIIENIYDTHRVVAEARLETSLLSYHPIGLISQSMQPGLPVRFIWYIEPAQPGLFPAKLWLYLHFIPLDGSSPPVRRVITSQLFSLRVDRVMGLDGSTARLAGAIGAVVGGVMCLDNLASRLFSAVWRRRKEKG